MTINWEDIVTIYSSQPWWVWPAGLCVAWIGMKWFMRAIRAHLERPIVSDHAFSQCGVSVDYRAGTITLPRGDVFPVECVRGLRWEDFGRSGHYRAVVEVDDLKRPIHPVGFSTPAGPEAFVSRLRTAIEKAGGPLFSPAASEQMEVVALDMSDPVTAAVATRAVPVGRRVSYAKTE